MANLKFTEPELKPCPFCGAAAEFKHIPEQFGYSSAAVAVRCSKCWAVTPASKTEEFAKGIGYYTVRAIAYCEVATAWNRRDGGA